MELDIHSIGMTPVQRQKAAAAAAIQQGDSKNRRMVQENQRAELTARNTKDFNPEEYLKDIVTITSIFNRKLKFFVNHNTNQVVVKVIDGETDKVIKEIPPEALQRLHSRLREAIGLLIDEEI
ncbi:MAG: flagellar protein FlaG [Spirochaetota bacterium]|nr:flagellar protein FlaG [Spirochaetota bacterium]